MKTEKRKINPFILFVVLSITIYFLLLLAGCTKPPEDEPGGYPVPVLMGAQCPGRFEVAYNYAGGWVKCFAYDSWEAALYPSPGDTIRLAAYANTNYLTLTLDSLEVLIEPRGYKELIYIKEGGK